MGRTGSRLFRRENALALDLQVQMTHFLLVLYYYYKPGQRFSGFEGSAFKNVGIRAVMMRMGQSREGRVKDHCLLEIFLGLISTRPAFVEWLTGNVTTLLRLPRSPDSPGIKALSDTCRPF